MRLCVSLAIGGFLALSGVADAQLSASLEQAKAESDASFTAQAGLPASALTASAPQAPAATAAKGLREEILHSFERNYAFPEGASQEVRQSVPRIVRGMLGSISLDKLQRIAGCMKGVIVVPGGRSPTELAPFAGLPPAKRSELDREWRHLGGCAYRFPDGSFMVLIKERYGGWISESTVVHEWGHVVHLCGLTGFQKELVAKIYADQERKGAYLNGPFEYFAQNTALWFQDGSRWVKDDVKMYYLLEAVYGSPRQIAD